MRTIEIRTTQNVTIEYELASLWERIVAFVIDGIIVTGFYILLMMLFVGATSGYFLREEMGWSIVFGLLPICGLLLYHFLSEALADGQSWGKRAMGIKVVRLDGQEAGLSDYLLRAVFLIVDSLASLGILGMLLISSSAKQQRLGDLTANTTVIRVRPSLQFGLNEILRISTLENYEPRYPQVRQLSEQDMLLIKSVIARYRNFPNAANAQAILELTQRLGKLLQLDNLPRDQVEFLKTLIRDYIVMTR